MTFIHNLAFYFLSIILITSCGGQEEVKNQKKRNPQSSISDSLNLWLNEGAHSADVMNLYPPRITELSNKLAIAVNKNQEWFFEFMKTVPDGEIMPYHKNIGLTETEYTELLDLQSDIKIQSSTTESFNLVKNGNSVFFETDGEVIKVLNYLSVDITNTTAQCSLPDVGSVTLYLKDTINVLKDNSLNSKWHGYRFVRKFGTLNQNLDGKKGIGDFDDLTKYELIIGRLEKNKKVYLSFKVQSVIDGNPLANNELPIIF